MVMLWHVGEDERWCGKGAMGTMRDASGMLRRGRRRGVVLALVALVALVVVVVALAPHDGVAAFSLVPTNQASPFPLPSYAHTPLPITTHGKQQQQHDDADDVPRATTRFAYVAMHYEGTPRDDEYLLGLRVMIRSLRNTGSTQDFVILLSRDARNSTREQLIADGCLVQLVDNLKNPFADTTSQLRRRGYNKRFMFAFNKLYLWSMTRYERVIYLDSDNIIMANPDELFMCGHFCVVFMNPLLFHTGLMVIKPDMNMFDSLVARLFSDTSYSHDGADQGFLCAVFDIENAPLFRPELVTKREFLPQRRQLEAAAAAAAGSQQQQLEADEPAADAASTGIVAPRPLEVPAMRLAMGYNLNHFYYYVTFSWDFFRRNDYYFNSYAVPGLTLAYPSAAWLKPWFWYPAFYFYHHWTWQAVRAELGISYWSTVASAVLRLAPIIAVAHVLAHASMRWSHLDWLRHRWYKLVRFAPITLGYVFGVASWFFATVTAIRSIPSVTPVELAYLIFVIYHVSIVCTLYTLVVASLVPHVAGSSASVASAASSDPSAPTTHLLSRLLSPRIYASFLVAHLLTFYVFHPYFLHFIVKIGFVECTAIAWIAYDAHLFRCAIERVCAARLWSTLKA